MESSNEFTNNGSFPSENNHMKETSLMIKLEHSTEKIQIDQPHNGSNQDLSSPDSTIEQEMVFESKGICARLTYVCKCCMWEYHHHPTEETGCCEKIHWAIMCPPHGILAKWMVWILLAFLLWAVPVVIIGDEALPGGNIFGIIVLLIACLLGGYLIERIPLPGPPLPPLLGMLLVGFALRNIPGISVAENIDPKWSSSLRLIALSIILTRAGLGLDGQALMKLKWILLAFSSLTAITECVTVAVFSTFLIQFPLDWGFVLGFVLCAVSPAVVVPSLLYLQDMGYGVKGGIPSFLIAGASLNDVIGITGFNVVLGMIFSDGEMATKIMHGPLELILGIVGGLFFGVLLWYLPSRDTKFCNGYRAAALLGLALFCGFGGKAIHFGGAGALATLVLAFVAGVRWGPKKKQVGKVFGHLWVVFQPLLFGLIGASVQLSDLEPQTIGLGALLVIIGLAVRGLVSFFSVWFSQFNMKEKVFVTIAWMPKATVQAAIGAVALDTAIAHGASDEVVEYGTKILTIAVLSILMTAPTGAAAIGLTGPSFLTKSDKGDEEEAL